MSVRGLYLFRQFGDQFAAVNVLRPYGAFNIALNRRDPGPDGTVGTGDDGPMVTIHDYDAAFRGSAFVGNRNINRPEGRNDRYQSVEAAVMKRSSDLWSLQASYTATKYHRWLVGIAQSPNDEYFPVDDAWRWSMKLNGNYALPHDVGVGAIIEFLNAPLGHSKIPRWSSVDDTKYAMGRIALQYGAGIVRFPKVEIKTL